MKTLFSCGWRVIAFFSILIIFQSAQGQHIFYLENDYKYALIYPKKAKMVSVRTKMKHNNFNGPDGIFNFCLVGDTILQRFGNDLSSLTDTKGYSAYGLFGNTIRINNNNHKLYLERGDSALYDQKKRITEIYNFENENRKYLKQFYLNDSIIITTNLIGEKPFIGFFMIDKYFNIKCWKGGKADSSMLATGIIDLNKIEFERVIRFDYDIHKREIDSIKHYDILEGREFITYTQWFVFKRRKPVKSFERNEETGKIEYEQIYSYRPVGSACKKK